MRRVFFSLPDLHVSTSKLSHLPSCDRRPQLSDTCCRTSADTTCCLCASMLSDRRVCKGLALVLFESWPETMFARTATARTFPARGRHDARWRQFRLRASSLDKYAGLLSLSDALASLLVALGVSTPLSREAPIRSLRLGFLFTRGSEGCSEDPAEQRTLFSAGEMDEVDV